MVHIPLAILGMSELFKKKECIIALSYAIEGENRWSWWLSNNSSQSYQLFVHMLASNLLQMWQNMLAYVTPFSETQPFSH